ncbi:MAG: heme exporter protein CcmB [Myxococcota bacterium]|nr:heme exporter protein CcmB [Myxococcota bacterium]
MSELTTIATPAASERTWQRPGGPGPLKTTLSVIKKDLLIEWRGRARVNATLFFAILTLLLFSFAMGPESKLLAKVAGGFFWLALLLSSVMSLSESMRIERDNDALEGLKLLPVSAVALFLGKAIVNTLYLFALALVLLPMVAAVYGVSFALGLGPLVGIMFLGSAAISAPGTLYAAIAVQARARDVLLPLLLFPVVVPALLGSVKATGLIIEGDPMGQLGGWATLLGAFCVAYWVLCTLLFGRVIEE